MIREYCKADDPGAIELPNGTHVREYAHGAVVRVYEVNGYDDSDFHAVWWNEANDRFEDVEYATTRAYTYDANAVVDAPPELIKRYEDDRAGRRRKWLDELEEAKRAVPDVGKTVVVVAGRKHKDKIGEVFWKGARPGRYYKNGYNKADDLHNLRLGVRLENGEAIWVNLLDARVIGFEEADPHKASSMANVGKVIRW